MDANGVQDDLQPDLTDYQGPEMETRMDLSWNATLAAL